MTTGTLTLEPTSEVVDSLLKWPKELRLDLAELLVDSVEEGGVSTTGRSADRELIAARIEAYERGEIVASDWKESLARIEAKFQAGKS